MAFNQAPEIHLSHPAKEFIDNRLDGAFHPAFKDDPNIDYSMELDRFVVQPESLALITSIPREIKKTKEIDDQEQCLKQAITEYVSHLKSKEKSKLMIDYEKSCRTWDDVIGAMNTARDRYDGKEIKGFCLTRTIRNGFRKFGNLQPSIESWLRLLPRDSLYGSLLCGGLEIIFGAAWQVGKMREDTYDALEQIPVVICKAQSLSFQYPFELLQSHVSQLYVAILDTIQHILSWYKTNSGVKYFASILRGDAYGEDLTKKLRKMKTLEERVEDQAFVDQGDRIISIHNNSNAHLSQTVEVLNGMKEMLKSQEVLQKYIYFMAKRGQEEQEQQYRRAREVERRKQWEEIQNREKTDDLIYKLQYEPVEAIKDTEQTLCTGLNLSLEEQDRATWILQCDQVRHWVSVRQPQILLVNSNETEHTRVSPASLFSAILITAIERSGNAIILNWFCGLRTNCGPLEILKSFVGQLLSKADLDLSWMKDVWFSAFDPNHPNHVLKLFCRLVKQQMEKCSFPVICVLDGLTFYEDRDRFEDLCDLMRELTILVDDGLSEQHIIKILATSPTRSSYGDKRSRLSPQEILDVPEYVDGANRGISDRDIKMVADLL